MRKMNIMKKVLALVLVLCTAVGMVIPAYAAGLERCGVSHVNVDTNGKYYITQGKNIVAKTKPSGGQTDFKLQQGSLIKVTGSDGQYYKMDMNGAVRYVKKSSVSKAGSTRAGDIYYTTKECSLRPIPYEGSTTAKLLKGSAVIVVGKLVNSKGNNWLMVYHQGKIHYLYEKNAKKADKVTLVVKAPSHELDTRGTMQMSVSVTPSAFSYTWSSSDPNVASVNMAGLVTGHRAGTTVINASINGVTHASWELTVTRNVSLDVKAYRQSTDYTCSAAAALAVLNYHGKAIGTSDTDLYRSTKGVVGNITSTINNYMGGTYAWEIFRSVGDYENAIYNSLTNGYPVIARVRFKKGYFNYSTDGHYTVIHGMYQDESGQIWLKVVDSYVDRYASNSYTNADTGEVCVPLNELYKYGTYGGTSDIYLIYKR